MKQQIQANKIDWKEVELGELVSKEVNYPIGDGDHGQIKPSMYQDKGIPYIRVGDMVADKICLDKIVYISEKVHRDNLKSELLPGDVLIAKTGATIGKVAIVPKNIQKANTTSSVGKITPDRNKILPEYLLYFIKTKEFIKQMWLVSIKSAQPGFNIINLKKFKIPLPFRNGSPDLKEQERIVSILEKAEALKQKGNNVRDLFDEYLKGIFWEMFYNKGFEEVNLGNKQYFEIIMGQSPAGKSYNQIGKGMPFFQGKKEFGEKYPSVEQWTTEPSKIAQSNDILISVRAPVGSINLANIRCCIGRGLASIRCKDGMGTDFVYSFLKIKEKEIENMGKGSTFKAITSNQLLGIKIPLPPLPLQQKFARIVEQVEKMKENVKKTQQNSEELFNSLMQKAFRGMLI